MAEDLWELEINVCTYGGLELDVLSSVDERGRHLAVHEFARAKAQPEDMGPRTFVTRCEIIFFERTLGDNHLARARAFDEMVNRGEAQTFVHPIHGSYRVKVGDVTVTSRAEPRDCLMYEVLFVEAEDEPTILDIGAGAPTRAGSAKVATASSQLDAAVAEVEAAEVAAGVRDERTAPLGVTVGQDAVTAVGAWEDPDAAKTLRDVNLEAVALHNKIESEMDRLEVATNIRRYPLLRSLTALSYSIRKAAQVFTERTPRVISYEVTASLPLLAIVQRIYGADQALDRYDEVLGLNDIRNPARIEQGTVLRIQSPAARRTRSAS